MNPKKLIDIAVRVGEQFIYWIVTIAILLLAIPLILISFFRFLIHSAGAPFKSAKNFIGLVIILLIISSGYSAVEIFSTQSFSGETRSLLVSENDNFRKIASGLHQSGIIRGEYLFRVAAVLSGVDKAIIPGRYDFSGKVSLYDVLLKLKRHDVATIKLTVPEGYNVYRVAALISKNLGIDSILFISRTFDTSFTKRKYNINGLEGYLFPETYQFWYGMKLDDIIDVMVSQFHRQAAMLLDSAGAGVLSPQKLLILASIIEAEAGQREEMPLISSVYHNRLRNGMLLQADPTILYAVGGVNRTLSLDDLKFDSPYNTYLYAGLPPGPINSPGMAAIRAAISPAVSDYYYFVADGTGQHIFSRTLDEHNTARLKVKLMKRTGADF
jgi:UPF0755 protein